MVLVMSSILNTKANDVIKVKELYALAKQKLKYDNVNKILYQDSIIVSFFDFSYFEKIDSKENSSEAFYKLFYIDKILNKLEYYNTKGEKKYELFFYYSDDAGFVFYTSFIYNNKKGEFARGFFLYDKERKENYYFSINEDVYAESFLYTESGETVELHGKLLSFDLESSTKDIMAIYKLDNELSPISKAEFYKDELLTYSTIKVVNDHVYEDMAIYAKQTCDINIELDKIGIDHLVRLMKGDLCYDGKLVSRQVDYTLNLGDNSWIFEPR